MSQITIAFVMDPMDSLTPYKDSTLAMIWAAQRRGWQTSYLQPKDLAWVEGKVLLTMRDVELTRAFEAGIYDGDDDWYNLGDERFVDSLDVNVLMMRKDPPFDMNYINATYLLEQAEAKGTLVVNRPASLRDCNEKFFTTSFPDLLPPQIVSSSSDRLIEFHARHQDVVFKPLDGMGGKGIFRVPPHDPNIHVILEMLTDYDTTQIVGQVFLPEIEHGDKRILLIDGTPVPYALARIPKSGETRGNLAAGGSGVGRPLTPRDREIAATIAPELRRRGLLFTGIDVIGNCLTEINVTCPTCIRELDHAFGLDIAMELMESIERRLK